MWKAKLEHNVIISTYNARISACEKSGRWQQALVLISEMWEAKMDPDVVSYSAGISACEKGGKWQWALALLGGMWLVQLEPDVQLQRRNQRVRERLAVAAGLVAAQGDVEGEDGAQHHPYNAGISACEKCEQWEHAIALLREMLEVKADPDVVSYSAGISACEKSEHWKLALALLSEMGGARVEANVISYSAGISACEKGAQWQRALGLLRNMWEVKLEANSATTLGSARARKESSGNRLC
ncbi:unnamed protein product [Prorocentrum cordatum]|uniref:Pentatricopeptide repeat-containing protein, chloroplastic n=1 Tax=Prorocentrum cordatum TaxID=2364126 RepID=A0ABN9W3F1_9DINO|nr:unnamed protein product [Polarella glacialis]